MKRIKSIQKETESFSYQAFPEVYNIGFRQKAKNTFRKFNTPFKAIWVTAIPFLFILLAGVIDGPRPLTWAIIKDETAKAIIDQRISNLAAIFSITLVVIGWLITNLTSKERLAVVILAQKTYLYPIFYYILSVIGALIFFSFLRDICGLNVGNIVISASLLIIVALFLIAFLFSQLLMVVNSDFITNALKEEVMKEIYAIARQEIAIRKSKACIKEICQRLKFKNFIGFGTDLSNHNGIAISPIEPKSELEGIDIFFQPDKYRIVDMDLSAITSVFETMQAEDVTYFTVTHLYQNIPGDYSAFFIDNKSILPVGSVKTLKRAFKVKTVKEGNKVSNLQFQQFLHKRYLKDIKEGQLENVKGILPVYIQIFQFENKLISLLPDDSTQAVMYGESLRTIFDSFYLSIDREDTEMFRYLNAFLYTQLNDCYQANNIRLFEEFSGLIIYCYEYVVTRKNNTLKYRDIYDYCTNRAPKMLKDRLSWGLGSRLFGETISKDELKKINLYSKILLNRFANLINACFQSKDLSSVRHMLNQLSLSSDSHNHKLSGLRVEISFLRTKKNDHVSAKNLIALQEEYQLEGFTQIRVRQIFKATFYWATFLYEKDILIITELNQIIREYQAYGGYIEYDFIDDLITISNSSRNWDFSWSHWDHIKNRPEGSYSPPSAEYWATFGAIVYSLYRNLPITYELDEISPEELTKIEYAIDTMLRIAKSFEDNGYEKWKDVFQVATKEDYILKLKSFREGLEKLQKSNVSAKEKMIAELELDPESVEGFTKILAEGWEKGNVINELFESFGNVTNSDEDSANTRMIGIKNNIWRGYKTSLIKSDDFRIPIFGIERIGQDIANVEEDTFLQNAIADQKLGTSANVYTEIDRLIGELKEKGKNTNVIILGFHVYEGLFSSKKIPHFSYDYSKQNESGFSTYGGTYREIPLIRVRSTIFTNAIMICDFKKAFGLKRRYEKSGYKDTLVVNIEAVTEEAARKIISENQSYWQGELSEEDAIISLMNDIVVSIYLQESFLILDKTAYEVLVINE